MDKQRVMLESWDGYETYMQDKENQEVLKRWTIFYSDNFMKLARARQYLIARRNLVKCTILILEKRLGQHSKNGLVNQD